MFFRNDAFHTEYLSLRGSTYNDPRTKRVSYFSVSERHFLCNIEVKFYFFNSKVLANAA